MAIEANIVAGRRLAGAGLLFRGGGISLKDGSCILKRLLKHSAVLILALLLVAGTLVLSNRDGGVASNGQGGLRTQQHRGSQAGLSDSASLAAGEVMLLHLSPAAGPGMPEPADILASLSRLGVEQGDLLGGNSILVRVPPDKLAAAQRVAGSALQAYAPSARLAPSLVSSEQSPDREKSISVDVTVFQPEDKVSVAQAVYRFGGVVQRGGTDPGRVLQVQLSQAHLEDLSQLSEVVYIEPATSYSLMNDRACDLVAATPLGVTGWLSPLQQGLTGDGQIIGLADTGLDIGSTDDIHPDLASVPGKMPKVVMLRSWAGVPVAADQSGHGTVMAATIAGTGAASSGRYQGVAPGASIYFQGLINSQGQLDPPPDLEDLFEPAYEAGVRIHVDGWGGAGTGYQDTASQTDHFIRENPDFLVIYSAGNNGSQAGSLTPEAYSKNALVVGASQTPYPAFNPQQVDSSQVCDFSSRGPTSDGRLKPDLLAPGAVISAKARLVTSEFDLGGGYYTYMEGTSMAAAVAGGSAALLREYLMKYEQVLQPTAALLKAALICGARTPEAGPSSDGSDGFGILDLGGTVLALHEKTFEFVDNRDGVTDGGMRTCTYQVPGGGSPFKATLAWTDPSAAPGSVHPLVNNLDLVVKDPGGKLWLGNAFLTGGKPDDVNNVEEVYIPRPEAGTYTIYVKGTSIIQNTVPGASSTSQDYALVYGQPLVRDVVQSVSKTVTLASGSEISLDSAQISFEQDGQIVNWPPQGRVPSGRGAAAATGGSQSQSAGENSICGADIYLPPAATASPSYAYLAGLTWQAPGVQLVDVGESSMFTEINPADRSGGYLLAPGASSRLTVNGSVLNDPGKLPPGGEVQAVINPSTQTVWSANVVCKEVDGYLDRVDLERQEVFLVGANQPLTLAPDASLAYLDEIVDADPADIPFGAGSSPAWDKLLPGLRLKLMLSPDSGAVMYMGAIRQLAVGTITSVDVAAQTITLSSGSTYEVGQGISVQLDDQAAGLSDLGPGQHAIAVLLPQTREILSLSVYSQVLYGQVVDVSADQSSLDLIDDSKEFHDLQFSKDTQVFRWGLPAGMNAVEPGSWARLYLGPGSGQIWRLDLAEADPEKTEVFESYNSSQQTLTTDKGAYRLTDRTMVTKNGYLVAPEDLVGGEEVTVTPLQADENGLPLLAAVFARMGPWATAPTLEVAAPWRHDYVILSGITSADRLYLYLPGESRQTVPVTPGKRFLYRFQLESDTAQGSAPVSDTAGGSTVQAGQQGLIARMVAVDSRTGGVSGESITIPARTGASLSDLNGNWAEADVEALLAQHLVAGYPDNTFRPDAPITRAEFVMLLAGALGWSDTGGPVRFSDAGAIPEWAMQAVECAVQQGLVVGYPDNTFRPDAPITRAEAAVLLDHAVKIFAPAAANAAGPAPSWDDWTQIPVWAQASVFKLYNAGILRGRSPQEFAPFVFLTRGESAAAVNRLLEVIRQA